MKNKEQGVDVDRRHGCLRYDCKYHASNKAFNSCDYIIYTCESKIKKLGGFESAKRYGCCGCPLFEPLGNVSDQKFALLQKVVSAYIAGMNDSEIANVTGISLDKISKWREDRGLPPNRRKDKVALDQARAMELYNAGMYDRLIAEVLGVTTTTVFQWRRRNKLVAIEKKRKDDVSDFENSGGKDGN